MKILHVITALTNGGAESILYRIVTKDKENIHEVVSMMDHGFYGERIVKSGIVLHTLDLPKGRITFLGVLKLFRLIRRSDFDIIQTWMYHSDIIAGYLAKIFQFNNVVWGIHNSNLDADKSNFSTRLIVKACAFSSRFIAKRIICCSEGAMRFHVKEGYNISKMTVVENGFDVEEFIPKNCSRVITRLELGLVKTDVVIGMVARWDPNKDHSNLFIALRKLLNVGLSDWYCALIGLGMTPKNTELVNLLDLYSLNGRVLLVGSMQNIPAVMNALDLHVLSSSCESFGNVTAEAMACGVPAVVTAVGAGVNIVGDTGWVVPPFDSEALYMAIRNALSEMHNSVAWNKRKKLCRSRIVKMYGLDSMINNYNNIWKEIYASSKEFVDKRTGD